MQDSKRDTDVKNRLLNSVGEGKGGMREQHWCSFLVASGEPLKISKQENALDREETKGRRPLESYCNILDKRQ